MNEKEPEIKIIKDPETIKKIILLPAIFAAILGVSATVGAVMRALNPPEPKYKIAIKLVPSEDDNVPLVDVRLVRQCVDSVIHVLPSPFTKTFYKDCE